MESKTSIKLFEQKQVRSAWDEAGEKWYFSIVDVVDILSDSPNPNNYWKVLKHRLKKEGSQLVTDCNQLKMPSSDGKNYKTDVADTEQLFRLIQSIPSPKAEPFKLWIAQVARERIDEIEDPEIGIDSINRSADTNSRLSKVFLRLQLVQNLIARQSPSHVHKLIYLQSQVYYH